MSLRGTIRRSDHSPLGSVEEVRQHLSDSFPGVKFTLQEEEPLGVAEAFKRISWFLRLWLIVLGDRDRYPHWYGAYEAASHVVEFYFEADEPVR